MPPTPVTPSPHRFVINKEHTNRQLPPQEQTPGSSTQQFNATPRFTFSSTPRPITSSQPWATSAASRYLTPRAKTAEKRPDLTDTSFDPFPVTVHDSIETDLQDLATGYTSAALEDDGEEERSLKRRRVSAFVDIEDIEQLEGYDGREYEAPDGGDHSLSLSPILSSPPALRRPLSTSAPRFLLSTPAPPSTPRLSTVAANTHVFVKPPRFRPPDSNTQAEMNSEPLPEHFSPHRKGQKYVPRGLAAEMRDWLANLESALPIQTHGHNRNGDYWTITMMIDEVNGNERDGMTLVRGRQIHKMDLVAEMADTIGLIRVLLVGEGAGNGLQRGSKIEVGSIVGIKSPVWEIVLRAEKWGVGVDWKVL